MAVHRNLTVISFGAIGDALMFISLLDAVHTTYPAIKLNLLALRQGGLPEALGKEYPFITCIDLKSWRGIFRALPLLVSRNTVLVPPSFGVVPAHIKILARCLTLLPGSFSVGFKDKTGHKTYTSMLEYNPHILFYDNLRNALTSVALPVPQEIPTYRVHAIPEILARFSLVPGTYVVVHPFAATQKRELPWRLWEAVLGYLRRTYPEMSLVVSGGTKDQDRARVFAGERTQILAGVLTLTETAEVLKGARLYMGVDTGITHLSALMRVPSVVVGNRSNPSWLPSYNRNGIVLTESKNCVCTSDKQGNCSVVEEGKEYFRCAADVQVSAIEEAVRQVLARAEGRESQ